MLAQALLHQANLPSQLFSSSIPKALATQRLLDGCALWPLGGFSCMGPLPNSVLWDWLTHSPSSSSNDSLPQEAFPDSSHSTQFPPADSAAPSPDFLGTVCVLGF